MLNKTAVRLAKKLLSLQIITEEVFDIYVYGLELLLSFFFSSSVIVLIGAILGRVIETLVFLLVFVLLRSFTGGYHANSYLMCSIVTFSTYGVVLLLSELLALPLIAYILLAIFGGVMVLAFVPIEHPNKRISDSQKKKYKIVSFILFLTFVALGILLCCANVSLSRIIFFTIMADLILLFVKTKKKGEDKYEVFSDHSC